MNPNQKQDLRVQKYGVIGFDLMYKLLEEH